MPYYEKSNETQLNPARNVSNPETYEGKLRKIEQYTGYLLKDRAITKLRNHFLINYDNIEQLENKLRYRINTKKIKPQYFWLFNLIAEWKEYRYLLMKPTKSLRKVLIEYFEPMNGSQIFEFWVFYKIIEKFETHQRGDTYKNENQKISIKYQDSNNAEWQKERNGNTTPVNRIS